MLGFVAIPRELLESDLFADADLLRVFIWLLSRANYREPRECFGVSVGLGQVIVGRRSMAEKMGFKGDKGASKVDRALKRLASPKYRLIERQPNHLNTLVTICHFERYRPKPKRRRTAFEPPREPQSGPAPRRQAARERTQTNQEPITSNQEQETKTIRADTEAERNEAPAENRSALDSARLELVFVPENQEIQARIVERAKGIFDAAGIPRARKEMDRRNVLQLAILEALGKLPEGSIDEAINFARLKRREDPDANRIACILGSLKSKLKHENRRLRDELSRVQIPERWQGFVTHGPQPPQSSSQSAA